MELYHIIWVIHGESLAITYYNILLALEKVKPNLIVIDTFPIYWESTIQEEKSGLIHDALDAYPISYTKFLTIKNLFSKENVLEKVFEYLFNFSIYHARWNELNKSDFYLMNEYEKGAKSLVNISKINKISNFESIEIYNKDENDNMRYLRKIIEYCKENGIEILPVFIPYYALDYQISTSKYVQKICDEYNVNYINFLNMDIANYDIDFADTSHLNVSGARKVTDYIGKYIIENYDIPDQRENHYYNHWYKDYNEYIDYKIRRLQDNKNNLNKYLMLLYGEKDIKYEIKVSSKREIKEGSTLFNLLKNLGNNYEIDDNVFEDKTIKITTWDKRNGSLINTLWW